MGEFRDPPKILKVDDGGEGFLVYHVASEIGARDNRISVLEKDLGIAHQQVEGLKEQIRSHSKHFSDPAPAPESAEPSAQAQRIAYFAVLLAAGDLSAEGETDPMNLFSGHLDTSQGVARAYIRAAKLIYEAAIQEVDG